MRHRVTFVHSPSDNVVKTLNSSYVELENVLTAREDKISFDKDRYSHISSLRVQIVKPFETTELTKPFSYDYQPGLHVYVVPQAMAGSAEEDMFPKQVSDVLDELFGILVNTDDMILSFNSFYYHTSEIPEVKPLFADKLGTNWDALDYFHSEDSAVIKSLEVALKRLVVSETSDYTEIGIFSLDEHSTADDIILTGIRAVFNDNDQEDKDEDAFVHKTMFHVKPRHRTLSLIDPKLKPNGLHPIFELDSPSEPTDEDVRNCKLYCYLTLENAVFLDRYQIPEQMQILANYGPNNLELPSYAIDEWGNEVLMEVDNPNFPVELTLHSRYQLPNSSRLHTSVLIDKPYLFYGCEAGSDAFLLTNSPFDNKNKIGGTYEKFFTDDTVFFQAGYRGSVAVEIPNATGTSLQTNIVTLGAVLLGLFIIGSKLWRRTEAKKEE